MRKSYRGRGEPEDTELNLVPIMNLVTILIPFLLMAVSFIEYAVIDTNMPAIGKPIPTDEKPEKEPLNLSIAITDQGYTVSGSDATLRNSDSGKGATIACKSSGCQAPADYDAEALTKLLAEIKGRWSDEETVILVPEPEIPYEVLVGTMDAARENPEEKVSVDGDEAKNKPLFPTVVVAAGVR